MTEMFVDKGASEGILHSFERLEIRYNIFLASPLNVKKMP
jgi:hypothetical protein